ncbi:MAG: C10 family peptidase [Bacteroidetes bacterium]|nr:C10 family peptidase [Bacteroidota bacterium]
MKKSFLLLIGLLFNAAASYCGPVSLNRATLVARNFYFIKSYSVNDTDLDEINPQLLQTGAEQDEDYYYIFGFGPGQGWVIVSAEDATSPIIGYSITGTYPATEAEISPEFRFWIGTYNESIRLAREQNLVASSETQSFWNYCENSNPASLLVPTTPLTTVAPLVKSTWDQSAWYNYFCPATGGTKYWNFPGQGTGSNAYFDPDNAATSTTMFDPSYGLFYTNLTTPIDWDAMDDTITGLDLTISKLSSDCGIMVNMDYSYSGSGAYTTDMITAMISHYYYSPDMTFMAQTGVANDLWILLLKNNLNASRPLIYQGYETVGGHEWICDGYEDNYNGTGQTYFHMNWGWGGSANGYFYITNLDPGSHYFYLNMGAVFSIHPTFMAPLPPTHVDASDNMYGDRIAVKWRWASNATHYKLYRNSVNNSFTATALTGWTTVTSFTDYGVVPGNAYYYWVKSAMSATGDLESGFSAVNQGSTPQPGLLEIGYFTNNSVSPRCYEFTNAASYWGVVACRPQVSDDWDLIMYTDNTFGTPACISSLGTGLTDLVVVDGNHTSAVSRGIKTNRFSGTGNCVMAFDGGAKTISMGTNPDVTWPSLGVVTIWDVYLTPGVYRFRLNLTSGNMNPGIALFSSASGSYYYGRSGAIGIADANGAGLGETFTAVIPAADYYGFVVWSNSSQSGVFNISIEKAGTWTGTVSNDWNNTGNWSASLVPTADVDVTIPNVTNNPWIWVTDAVCKSLTVQAGSGNYIRVYNHTLTINSDATFYGELMMDNAVNTAKCNILGNVHWGNGSSAYMANLTTLSVEGDWEFLSGSSVNLTGGEVDFTGNTDAYIRSYEADCQFNTIGVYKDAAVIMYSGVSTQSLKIAGNLYITTGATLALNCDSSVYLSGSLWNVSGHFHSYYGNMILKGSGQALTMVTGDFFNNLVINSSGNINLITDITTKGFIQINSGILNPTTSFIYIGGDWINNAGAAAFAEGTSRVIFNGGNYPQYCSDETFNILEVYKPAGGALRVDGGSNITCQSYDWHAGTLTVLSGTFTANMLVDNGIAGSFYVYSGGTINLHNPGGYVDLNGEIHVLGGNFNVYGGTTDSYWPYTSNASVTMTGGTLDFKDVGIKLNNTASYTFSENINGGLIRAKGNFFADRPEFTPSGGTVEVYGTGANTISNLNGSNFYNLKINKASPVNDGPSPGPDEQATSEDSQYNILIVPETVLPANTITMTSALSVLGNLEIVSGTLATANNPVYINGNWSNNVGSSGFDEGTSNVFFSGALPSQILTNETFYNLVANKTYASVGGLEIMTSKTINCINSIIINDGNVQLDDLTTLNTKEIQILANSGLNAASMLVSINVTGNWTDNNTTSSSTLGFAHGTSSTVYFKEGADQTLNTMATTEEFYHLIINKSAGSLGVNKGIRVTGDFSLTQGSFVSLVTGLNHYFQGDFTVSAGTSWMYGNSTVNFTGGEDQLLSFTPASGQLYHVTVDKTAGSKVIQISNVYSLSNGNLLINSGMLDLNTFYFRCTGNVTINNNGVIRIPSSSWLEVGNTYTLAVNSGGLLDVAGTVANPAKVTHHSGYYNLNVENGGSISAVNGVFEYINTNGVYLKNGSMVDDINSFKACTFRNGVTGGTLLKIDNNQDISILEANFPANTWSGSSNVSKTVNQGNVNFYNYSGAFSGETFDNDTYNRVLWSVPLSVSVTSTLMTVCEGSAAQLQVNVFGGAWPFIYSWSGPGLSDYTISNPMVTPSGSTTYSVTVTDHFGYITSGSVTLNTTANPVADAGPDVTIMTGGNTTLNGQAGGATPPYTFLWSPSTGLSGTNISNPTASPASTTTYTLQVTSSEGCSSSDQMIITVNAGTNQLTGTLTYNNLINTPLNGTKVYLKTGSLAVDSTTTNTGGGFIFNNVIPGTHTLDARCTKSWGGVNATDALKIMRHFVQYDTLAGLKKITADLDGSGYVNTVDALLAMRRYVGIVNLFSIGDWVFEHPSFSMPGAGVLTVNFKGLCSGDVDGSYNPPVKAVPGVEMIEKGELLVGSPESVSIPLSIESPSQVGAISLILNYNTDYLNITSIKMKSSLGDLVYSLHEGEIRIAWCSLLPLNLASGEPVLFLQARIKGHIPTSGITSWLEAAGESSLAAENARVLSGSRLVFPALIPFSSMRESLQSSLSPNPFFNNTTFSFNLAEPATINLIIRNMLGETVFSTLLGKMDEGDHQYTFKRNNLPAGTYEYFIEAITEKNSSLNSGKMVLMR